MKAKVITKEEFMELLKEHGEKLKGVKVGNMRRSKDDDDCLMLYSWIEVGMNKILADDAVIVRFFD